MPRLHRFGIFLLERLDERLPRTKADLAITAAIAASISGLIDRYWAWRSAKGTIVIRLGFLASGERAHVAGGDAGIDAGLSMFRVTTAPAPITTLSQIETGMIVAFEPIETLLPIVVGSHKFRSPRAGPPLREAVVDEHHAVADEAILADRHQLADEAVALHAGARADRHVLLDLDERARRSSRRRSCSRRGCRARRRGRPRRTRHRRFRPVRSRAVAASFRPARPAGCGAAWSRSVTCSPVSIELVERGDQFEAARARRGRRPVPRNRSAGSGRHARNRPGGRSRRRSAD